MNADYASLIRDVPDFPQPGVLFRDITPLLADAGALRAVVQDLAAPFHGSRIDQVVAIEARGYVLGAPVAVELGAGFVPVRKAGKLPRETHRAAYALEYGEAAIEMHDDALHAHDRVLVIDDVIATGGTLAATLDLVERAGASVIGIAVLIELTELNGRSALGGRELLSLIKM